MPDNRRIDRSTFECIQEFAVKWVKKRFCNSRYWRSVAELNALFSEKHAFCYEADMVEVCRMAGLQIRMDGMGKHWVKAHPRDPGAEMEQRK